MTAEASAWYLAETPEHAVAEKLQDLRNRVIVDEYLFERGHRLALVAVEVDNSLTVADLCDPEELVRRGVAPDELAYRDRGVTQAIARDLHLDAKLAGLRWWSALIGEWHTIVLFSDRLPRRPFEFSEPEPLGAGSVALAVAATALGIEIADS